MHVVLSSVTVMRRRQEWCWRLLPERNHVVAEMNEKLSFYQDFWPGQKFDMDLQNFSCLETWMSRRGRQKWTQDRPKMKSGERRERKTRPTITSGRIGPIGGKEPTYLILTYS